MPSKIEPQIMELIQEELNCRKSRFRPNYMSLSRAHSILRQKSEEKQLKGKIFMLENLKHRHHPANET